MTQSYSQIVRQIESLQRKADSARKKEVSGVVSRIKEAISFYHLTAHELGLAVTAAAVTRPSRSAGTGAKAKAKKGAAKSKSKFGDAAKYRDASGNEWVGRGPRPIWLRQAIASGKSLADFAVGGTAPATPPAPTAPATAAGKAGKKATRKSKARRSKKSPVAKYKDAASGKTWSGRGRKPAWFVAALAEGKPLESMAA